VEAVRLWLTLLLVLVSGAAYADSDIQIKHIRIIGLEYSNARVVVRELPFTEGDIWQPEFAGIGMRRLRNLGLFSEVVITPPDSNGVVRVRVDDRWPLWLLPEASRADGGASSAGLTLTEYNLWGLHHHLRLATRRDTGKNFSANNGSSYQGSYIWRRINDTNYGMDLSVNRGSTIFDAYQSGVISSSYLRHNSSWSAGIRYGLGPVPGEGWDIRFGFSSDNSSYQLRSGSLLSDIKGLHKKTVQFSAGYRIIDEHITWLTGSELDYNLDISHRVLGSDINSYRQTFSWHRYVDIGQQNTMNMRVNAGLISGELLRDGLFDVGDGSGIRGYFPGELQGNRYVYGTVEGRFPLEINSNVQLVAFIDVGHVNNNGSSALNRDVVASVGGGVRWTLRWLVNGMLRADIAYGSATQKWRLHLGSGQAF